VAGAPDTVLRWHRDPDPAAPRRAHQAQTPDHTHLIWNYRPLLHAPPESRPITTITDRTGLCTRASATPIPPKPITEHAPNPSTSTPWHPTRGRTLAARSPSAPWVGPPLRS